MAEAAARAEAAATAWACRFSLNSTPPSTVMPTKLSSTTAHMATMTATAPRRELWLFFDKRMASPSIRNRHRRGARLIDRADQKQLRHPLVGDRDGDRAAGPVVRLVSLVNDGRPADL